MTTVARHANNIIALAQQADDLIEQLRPVLEKIEAAEIALHREAVISQIAISGDLAGRRRLAWYAHGRVFKPQFSKTVSDVANAAWRGVA